MTGPQIPTPAAAISLHAHPPERGGQGSSLTLTCCGCCCCCCCLHSVGSLIGAAAASPPSLNALDEHNPFTNSERSAAPLYWSLLLVGMAGTTLWFGFSSGGSERDWVRAFFWLILWLPVVQLGVSVVAFMIIPLVPRFSDERACFGSLARITAYSFAGAALGTLIMGGGCIGLVALERLAR